MNGRQGTLTMHAIIAVFDDIEAVEMTYVPHEPRGIVDPSNGRTFGWVQWRAPKQSLAERYDEIRRAAMRMSSGQYTADVAAYIDADRDGRLALRAKYATD